MTDLVREPFLQSLALGSQEVTLAKQIALLEDV
jgi:hypothetical protein